MGLLVSWHAGTAAGASIAASSIALAGISALVRGLADRTRTTSTTAPNQEAALNAAP